MRNSRSSDGFLKSLFGVLSLFGFLWLMLIGVSETGLNTTVISQQQGESLKPKADLIKEGDKVQVGFLNMSKRRIPNGPDPIHNRRAGNSRQPPGRA